MTINWINCAARFGVGAPVDLTGVGDGSLTATEKRAVRTVLREACSMVEFAERLLVSSDLSRNGETPRVPVSVGQGTSDDIGRASACPVPRGAIPE